jgi:hypothetical protein
MGCRLPAFDGSARTGPRLSGARITWSCRELTRMRRRAVVQKEFPAAANRPVNAMQVAPALSACQWMAHGQRGALLRVVEASVDSS